MCVVLVRRARVLVVVDRLPHSGHPGDDKSGGKVVETVGDRDEGDDVCVLSHSLARARGLRRDWL